MSFLIKKLWKAVFSFALYGFKNRAWRIVKNPTQIRAVVDDAESKLSKVASRISINKISGFLKDVYNLIRAYVNGDYRKIPLKTIALSVAAVLYFLSPLDLSPDFLPFFGFLDDVAILTWLMDTISSEMNKFNEWQAMVDENTYAALAIAGESADLSEQSTL